MIVKLTYGELRTLLLQNPAKTKGGFQSYLVQLGYRVDSDPGEVDLDDGDLAKINRYAMHYGKGGYQSRLFKIFGRTLGQILGWNCKPSDFDPTKNFTPCTLEIIVRLVQ